MKQDIEFKTADGVAKAALFRPDNGAPAERGVIFYMEIGRASCRERV